MQPDPSLTAKILPLEELLPRLARERAGRAVVFTNGCFDILHPGHVDLLCRARALGGLLVVGLNSDGSVRGLKGLERPAVAWRDRALVLRTAEPPR